MAYEGAAGSSYEEFKNYFGADSKQVTDGYFNYVEQVRTFTITADDCSEILLSNSFWYKPDKEIKKDYLETLEKRYYAQTDEFTATDQSVKRINEWVDTNTNHLISEMVDLSTLSANDYLLLNTLYFKGLWRSTFSESATTKENFTNLDGSVSEVSMMHGTGNFYFETDSGVGFDKVYYPAKLRFVAFLPNDEQFDICDFDVAEYMQARRSNCDVIVNMPSFQADASLTMNDALKALGFEVYPGVVNFIMFRTSEDDKFMGLQEKLMRKGVLIRSCENFHGTDDRDYRIAVRGHEENLRFIKILEELAG
jgi:serine protease inhibitor